MSAPPSVLEVIQSVVTTSAIIIGGIFAYFRFVKDRSYRSRLELEVSGRLIIEPGYCGVVCRCAARNVGSGKISIQSSYSTLEVLVYRKHDVLPVFHKAPMQRAGVMAVLEMHDAIEPSECIVEERLVTLQEREVVAVGLIFRLLDNPPLLGLRRKPVLWTSKAILTPPTSEAGPRVT
jgi:hypothetical protein